LAGALTWRCAQGFWLYKLASQQGPAGRDKGAHRD
jgi:hypothetical protein